MAVHPCHRVVPARSGQHSDPLHATATAKQVIAAYKRPRNTELVDIHFIPTLAGGRASGVT